MRIIQDKYYPWKVWAATILVAPLLHTLFIVVYLGQGDGGDLLAASLFLICCSILFSIPTVLLFFVSFEFLNSIIRSEWLLKVILLSVCIIFLVLTDYFILNLFNRNFDDIKTKFFILDYSFCIIVFGIYFGRNN